jgi:hypothetical protein
MYLLIVVIGALVLVALFAIMVNTTPEPLFRAGSLSSSDEEVTGSDYNDMDDSWVVVDEDGKSTGGSYSDRDDADRTAYDSGGEVISESEYNDSQGSDGT